MIWCATKDGPAYCVFAPQRELMWSTCSTWMCYKEHLYNFHIQILILTLMILPSIWRPLSHTTNSEHRWLWIAETLCAISPHHWLRTSLASDCIDIMYHLPTVLTQNIVGFGLPRYYVPLAHCLWWLSKLKLRRAQLSAPRRGQHRCCRSHKESFIVTCHMHTPDVLTQTCAWSPSSSLYFPVQCLERIQHFLTWLNFVNPCVTIAIH
jgi:hypothetical protein